MTSTLGRRWVRRKVAAVMRMQHMARASHVSRLLRGRGGCWCALPEKSVPLATFQDERSLVNAWASLNTAPGTAGAVTAWGGAAKVARVAAT